MAIVRESMKEIREHGEYFVGYVQNMIEYMFEGHSTTDEACNWVIDIDTEGYEYYDEDFEYYIYLTNKQDLIDELVEVYSNFCDFDLGYSVLVETGYRVKREEPISQEFAYDVYNGETIIATFTNYKQAREFIKGIVAKEYED